MIATRWSHRLLGLVSTMILARLLMPEDFGLVATVAAVVSIIDGFFDFGFDLALIHNQRAGRPEFDAAWTLRLIKSLIFGGLLMVASPWMADYANAPEVIGISLIMGASLAIKGLENIGTVTFHRELEFDRLFRFRMYPRLMGVATTIALAVTLRSYWAIVLGAFARYTYEVAFSYGMSPYRPRFRLQGIGQLWQFSRWILVTNIARQLFNAADRFVLTGLISKRELGFYSVGVDVAGTVTVDLMSPAGSALTPGFAKLQNEPDRLRNAFVISTSIFVALITPASVGLWCVAPELTAVILGAQWTEAAPLIGLFAFFWLFFAIAENLGRFMTMTGLQASAARIGLVRTLVFLALLYPAFQFGGLSALILMKTALSAVEAAVLTGVCTRHLRLPAHHIFAFLWRPALAAGAMAALLTHIPFPADLPTLGALALKAVIGALIYAGSSMLLWQLGGKPSGLESTVLGIIRKRCGAAGAA
ncbi:oligosaccharide flippase family protein [Denitromonas iodatirespirans]|uniref:Oligosaccharide flippase family protein n=1 Tax=Denitromonas iodatirespirans TaxID=2795389 RepID=A0A944D9Q1_DENI1|nr:oligosaccharide flippase family protein [Denitromonas iodatirespirans]MBT0960583.1 oligosaccharide flippase family protein [Denitromonas iodatirespirans]